MAKPAPLSPFDMVKWVQSCSSVYFFIGDPVMPPNVGMSRGHVSISEGLQFVC